MTAQRDLRGRDPPPPLRGAPARVPPPHRDGLHRPRRAAAAARRQAASPRGPGSCASAGATISATPACRSTTRCASWSPSGRAARRRARSGCSTHLRTFGHCFNPVSFYYCFARRRRAAARRSSPRSPTRPGASATPTCCAERRRSDGFDKALHVSPFMGMDQRYTWRAPAPGETLSVHIESSEQGRRVFDATLALRRTRAQLALARPRHRAPPRRDAAHAGADLRPRGRAQAARRAGPPASGSAAVMIEPPRSCTACCGASAPGS